MKVNLDKYNNEQIIKVYCSKVTGKVKIVYIDKDINKEIYTVEKENLPLGENNINIKEIEGYKIDKVEVEGESQLSDTALYTEEKLDIYEQGEFDIDNFTKDLSSVGIFIGDDDNE